MGHGHDHGLSEVRHEKPLWWALGLTGTFLVVEVIGGLLTNSLALLSDAAHMATDTAGLVIALVAVRLARRPPDARRTFGYARLEALGALANGVLLLGVAAYILWEAVGRFRAPPPVAATGMLRGGRRRPHRQSHRDALAQGRQRRKPERQRGLPRSLERHAGLARRADRGRDSSS